MQRQDAASTGLAPGFGSVTLPAMPPPHPTRREALRAVAGAAAMVAFGRSEARAEAAAPSGHIRHSVCRWCYKQIPLPDLARGAKEIGLESIELLDPADWPVVQSFGLTCAMANGVTTIPDGFNRLENHARYVPGMIDRIRACAKFSLPHVICFSGYRRGMPDEQGLENCAVGLRQIVGEAERQGVTVCMELLNSRVDHKDYMCDHTPWGVELVRRVGSERFKLLYDIYHMQIMEGDIIRTIRDHHEAIAHFHTGGVPGRHEIDGAQELNYRAVMRAIADTGYRGFVAQEFIPTRDPLASLREAVQICTV
ncbi:MAG TPA: TIM barrel protein [Opitutaceae bacterium]|jgi:hydroxypyruvate isomerase|nr:TIM barrel protein [Opitutaceae bacterium]